MTKLFDMSGDETVRVGESIEKSWAKQESVARVYDSEHGHAIRRPAPTHNLFVMDEAVARVVDQTPIQQQRTADGTPHTVVAHTGLRPKDPELYLSKAFANPDVPKEANPATVKRSPDEVVKAFLEG